MPRNAAPARQLLQRRQQALADAESRVSWIDKDCVYFMFIYIQHGVAGNSLVLHRHDAATRSQHGGICVRHGRRRPHSNLLGRIMRGATDAHGHRAQGPQGVDVGGQGRAQGDGHGWDGFREKRPC